MRGNIINFITITHGHWHGHGQGQRTELLLLHFSWGDGWLLEDGTDPGSRGDGVVELLIVAVITANTREVKVFPLRSVDTWAVTRLGVKSEVTGSCLRRMLII